MMVLNLHAVKVLNIIQIMPGLEGDLEEWQTPEANVHAHIYIHYFYPKPLVFVGDNTTRSITIYLY